MFEGGLNMHLKEYKSNHLNDKEYYADYSNLKQRFIRWCFHFPFDLCCCTCILLPHGLCKHARLPCTYALLSSHTFQQNGQTKQNFLS